MEKPGRKRRYFSGHGLLTVSGRAYMVLFLLGLVCAEVRPDDALTVIVQAGPGPVQVDTPWIVSLLVDHGKPEELKVEFPPLTGSLVLERVRTGPRVMEGAGEEVWTHIECVFIPQRAGRASLEFLKIEAPGREFVTGSLAVEVLGPLPGAYRPRLSWAAPLPLFRAGERTELTLLLSGWDPAKPLVFPLPFHIELSPFLILESRAPLPAEQRSGAVLVLVCIPLEKGSFSLPPPRLEYQSETLTAPALNFSAGAPVAAVAPAAAAAAALPEGAALSQNIALSPSAALSPAASGDGSLAAVFPRKKVPFLPFIGASYAALAGQAEARWDEGDYAGALAALREGERDLLPGPALAALRLEAEKALGLDFTYDEPWRPRLLLRVAAILLSFTLVALCLWGILRRLRGERFRFSARVSAAVLAAGLLLGIGGIAFTGKGLPETGNKAVLYGGAAYRVPDYSSGVSAEFREGQPALIRARTGLWVYAETYDGLSGWIPGDRVILY